MTVLAVTADNIVLWLLATFGSLSIALLAFIAKTVWDLSIKFATVTERTEKNGENLTDLSKRVESLDSRLIRVEQEHAG